VRRGRPVGQGRTGARDEFASSFAVNRRLRQIVPGSTIATIAVMYRLCLLAVLLVLAGCVTPPAPAPAAAPAAEQPTFSQVGVASWYGATHQGHQTANGEKFDRRGMTAAHRTLPFDTVVRVTNLGSGKSVKVRINDRGPYGAGRIIDLSESAAKQLDIGEDGTAKVRIEAFASDQP
jgi:rare lipoprotein A